MARIRHLAILTEDVEKLVKFYTSAFGLKIVNGIGTATYLSDGHINLAIIPIEPERKIEGTAIKARVIPFWFRGGGCRWPARGLQRTQRHDRHRQKTAKPRGRIPGSRSRRQSDRSLATWMADLTP